MSQPKQIPLRTVGRRPSSQNEQILNLLRSRHGVGVTSRELNRIAFRYSARIHELRQRGHDIRTVRMKAGLYRFIYYKGDPWSDGR